MKKIFITLAIAISLFHSVDARVRGRVEAAPLYLHIGVVQSGQTTQRIDMYGGRLDATILPFEGYGVCLKPFGFGGWGNGSDIYSYGLGLGHYTPISDRITLIPVVGVSRTHMETQLDVPALALYNLSQRLLFLCRRRSCLQINPLLLRHRDLSVWMGQHQNPDRYTFSL